MCVNFDFLLFLPFLQSNQQKWWTNFTTILSLKKYFFNFTWTRFLFESRKPSFWLDFSIRIWYFLADLKFFKQKLLKFDFKTQYRIKLCCSIWIFICVSDLKISIIIMNSVKKQDFDTISNLAHLKLKNEKTKHS